MAKFVKAPLPPEPEPPTPSEAATDWLADYGIATGPIGAILVVLGAILLLVGALRLWSSLRVRFFERHFDGMVTEVEPGRAGGYYPVIDFVDGEGQRRRFTAGFTTANDPTGRQVLVRLGRARPEVVTPGPSPLVEALGLVVPWALGAMLLGAGLTGRLLGVIALPLP